MNPENHEVVSAISLLIGAQNVIYVTAVTTSGLMVHFFKTKPPGSQTILDLIAIDTCYSQVAFLTTWNVIINFGHFHGQLEYEAGQLLLGSAVLSLEWMVANCQSHILFNAILIFKPHVLEGIAEKDLRWANQGCVWAYVIVAKTLDSFYPQRPKALEYMTGQDEVS